MSGICFLLIDGLVWVSNDVSSRRSSNSNRSSSGNSGEDSIGDISSKVLDVFIEVIILDNIKFIEVFVMLVFDVFFGFVGLCFFLLLL